jgi:hypothetical protein
VLGGVNGAAYGYGRVHWALRKDEPYGTNVKRPIGLMGLSVSSGSGAGRRHLTAPHDYANTHPRTRVVTPKRSHAEPAVSLYSPPKML